MKFRRTVLPLAIAASISVLLPTRTYAGTPEQDAKNYTQTPSLEEYRPRSTLVTREHKIERARFPFIDIHSHHANPTAQHVDQLVKEMDTINLRVIVNLSGGTGDQLRQTVATMKGRYPDRFVVFANLSYDDLNTPGYGKRAAARSEEHTSELQSHSDLVCRLLLEKKKKNKQNYNIQGKKCAIV